MQIDPNEMDVPGNDVRVTRSPICSVGFFLQETLADIVNCPVNQAVETRQVHTRPCRPAARCLLPQQVTGSDPSGTFFHEGLFFFFLWQSAILTVIVLR